MGVSTALLQSMSGDVPAERFVGLGLAGIVPVLLFASFARPIQLLLIGALTGANGWIVGWVNEKGAGARSCPAGRSMRVRTCSWDLARPST